MFYVVIFIDFIFSLSKVDWISVFVYTRKMFKAEWILFACFYNNCSQM